MVPFMALAYIVMAVIIILVNIQKLPGVISLVFSSALGLNSAFGGIVGTAISWGVKRGVYSNEAGQGTGPQAAAAAEVAHPAQQGLVQAFSVYVDTLFVCSATGFMLLMTGMYNTADGKGGFLVQHLPGVPDGPIWTQSAVNTLMTGLGGPFVAVALFFFAFTTLMAYAYYAESNVAYIFKKNPTLWINFSRLFVLIATFYGAVREAKLAWALGDIGVALMAWLNIIAILILGQVGLKVLKDYERQRGTGKPLEFHPQTLGIRNAQLWEDMNK
jgi:AGCS family alanine or glycine:cation symporter